MPPKKREKKMTTQTKQVKTYGNRSFDRRGKKNQKSETVKNKSEGKKTKTNSRYFFHLLCTPGLYSSLIYVFFHDFYYINIKHKNTCSL